MRFNPHHNEAVLIDQAVGGDVAAQQELLCWYYDQLVSYIQTKLNKGERHRFDAEDIVQLAMLKVFSNISRFEAYGDGAFAGWLMHIADNTLTDERRKRMADKRSGQHPHVRDDWVNDDDSVHGIVERISDAYASPSVVAVNTEAIAAVRTAILDLPDVECDVIRMRYLDGLDYRTIAERLGRTEGAVRSIAARARHKLEKVLDPT